MIDNDVLAYATLLWSSLVEAAPKDTGNMANKISIKVIGDQVQIVVSPGVDYASKVNNTNRICKKHHKNHYHWIQDTCEQIGKVYASTKGGKCINEFE